MDPKEYQNLPKDIQRLASIVGLLTAGKILDKYNASPVQRRIFFKFYDQLLLKGISLKDFPRKLSSEWKINEAKINTVCAEIYRKMFYYFDDYFGTDVNALAGELESKGDKGSFKISDYVDLEEAKEAEAEKQKEGFRKVDVKESEMAEGVKELLPDKVERLPEGDQVITPKEQEFKKKIGEVLTKLGLSNITLDQQKSVVNVIRLQIKGLLTVDEASETYSKPLEGGGTGLVAGKSSELARQIQEMVNAGELTIDMLPIVQRKKTPPPSKSKRFEVSKEGLITPYKSTSDVMGAQPRVETSEADETNEADEISDKKANEEKSDDAEKEAGISQKKIETSLAGEKPLTNVPSSSVQQGMREKTKELKELKSLDDIKSFSASSLNQWGNSTEEIVSNLKKQLQNVANASKARKTEIADAWKESGIHKLYIETGNAVSGGGKNVIEVASERKANSQDYLTEPQFYAIAGINKALLR